MKGVDIIIMYVSCEIDVLYDILVKIKLCYEIMNSIEYLRKARIGALIVVERDVSLHDYIERSKAIYADISSELLISIFFQFFFKLFLKITFDFF